MTNRSVRSPSSPGPAVSRAASRQRVLAQRRQVRRQRALIGTLLAVTLALLALALPSAAGAISGGTPAAWIAAGPGQHAATGTAAGRRAARATASPDGSAARATTSPVPPTSAPPVTPSTTTAAPVHTQTTPAPSSAPAPPPLAGAPAPAVAGDEGEVLALVNQQRAGAGCAPLIASSALATLARAHSADMRDRGYFSHNTPEGLDPFQRAQAAGITTMRAENIAMGQQSPADVMAAWMASPGHRANILDCSLRTLGVGVAYGSGGPWWTQDFGI